MKPNNTSRTTYLNMYNTYLNKIPNNPNLLPTATDIIFLYLQYKKFKTPETLHIYLANLHDYLHFFTNLTIPARFQDFSY